VTTRHYTAMMTNQSHRPNQWWWRLWCEGGTPTFEENAAYGAAFFVVDSLREAGMGTDTDLDNILVKVGFE